MTQSADDSRGQAGAGEHGAAGQPVALERRVATGLDAWAAADGGRKPGMAELLGRAANAPRKADPVLVYAPLRHDGPALTRLLRDDGVRVTLCTDLDAMRAALDEPVGMFVFTQEAFSPDMLAFLRPWLEAQEVWSEPPVVALLDPRQHGRSRSAHLTQALPNATILVLERPVRALEFLSSVRISLQTRRRQLDLRDQFLVQADLLRELSHRVKNALANVYAVYRMTYRHSADLQSFGPVFEARLQALSRVHQMLTTSGWQGADLEAMAQDTLAPYGAGLKVGAVVKGSEAGNGDREAEPPRVTIAGPSVPLPPRQALSMALTLHELATNAAKYGALSVGEGHIDLTWSVETSRDEDDRRSRLLTLAWRESDGPEVSDPEASGFGTTFIRSALRAEQDGRVDFTYRADGLTCDIAFRLDG